MSVCSTVRTVLRQPVTAWCRALPTDRFHSPSHRTSPRPPQYARPTHTTGCFSLEPSHLRPPLPPLPPPLPPLLPTYLSKPAWCVMQWHLKPNLLWNHLEWLPSVAAYHRREAWASAVVNTWPFRTLWANRLSDQSKTIGLF